MQCSCSDSETSDSDLAEMANAIYGAAQPQRAKVEHFHLPTSVRLVPIPPELENEPFSVTDTNLRPELRHTDHFFLFRIIPIWTDMAKPVAFVDWLQFSYSAEQNLRADELKWKKLESRFSVIDVYRQYGLNVACSYLTRICDNPDRQMVIYLV